MAATAAAEARHTAQAEAIAERLDALQAEARPVTLAELRKAHAYGLATMARALRESVAFVAWLEEAAWSDLHRQHREVVGRYLRAFACELGDDDCARISGGFDHYAFQLA